MDLHLTREELATLPSKTCEAVRGFKRIKVLVEQGIPAVQAVKIDGLFGHLYPALSPAAARELLKHPEDDWEKLHPNSWMRMSVNSINEAAKRLAAGQPEESGETTPPGVTAMQPTPAAENITTVPAAEQPTGSIPAAEDERSTPAVTEHQQQPMPAAGAESESTEEHPEECRTHLHLDDLVEWLHEWATDVGDMLPSCHADGIPDDYSLAQFDDAIAVASMVLDEVREFRDKYPVAGSHSAVPLMRGDDNG